jgi:predicted nucleic acid-binding protein
VRAEAGAVERIMKMVREGVAVWVSSTVLNIEVSRNPDLARRREAEALLSFADELFVPELADANRARQIEELGFTSFDALHLACAERLAADVFLTTDDVLLRRAQRVGDALHVRAENPISWYQDVRP